MRETSGWQPIETAPKGEDEEILVYCQHGYYVVTWIVEDRHSSGWWYVHDNKHGPYALRGDGPTHWQPLPLPPAHQEKGGER